MTIAASPGEVRWHQANQDYTAAAVRAVRDTLERAGDGRRSPPADRPEWDPTAEVGTVPGGMALDHVSKAFGLSAFERQVLVLCAGMEMDGSFPALCASACGDAHRPYVTFGLALALFPEAHWSALSPTAPLRCWRLIELAVGAGLTSSPLRIDERILHFLAGLDSIDERLASGAYPASADGALVPSHAEIAAAVAGVWSRVSVSPLVPTVQLCGDASGDARSIAVHACRTARLRPWVISAAAIPRAPGETEAIAQLWARERMLSRRIPIVSCEDHDAEENARPDALARFCARVQGPVVITARDRRRLGHVPSVAFDVAKPQASEQAQAWRAALGGAAARLNGQVENLVSHFNLSAVAIRDAAAAATGGDAAASGVLPEPRTRSPESHALRGGPPDDGLWDACRSQARPRLDDLAQRLEPGAAWDDLVLPDGPRHLLQELAAHVRHRTTVYERWGFAGRGTRGLGITALFAGASGTGKTMAAEVLAGELRLDLYRIDLASVVSKYIGETEKNLRRIFDAAENGGAILMFDEADALFGRRSEVKDSHDRYANIEVSYLLQRMESYRGLAILTTNLKSVLDPAFLRRIRFVVQFPFPDVEQRRQIWGRAFPGPAPTCGLEAERLAQLNIAGGNIRNIALGAAFMAADDGVPIGMSQVLRAARTEYAKIEKQLTDAELSGWPKTSDPDGDSARPSGGGLMHLVPDLC
jgi:hypothetical protein